VSGLRARLADALRLHGDTCTRANADHLANVLLSLPGVAIERDEYVSKLIEALRSVAIDLNTVAAKLNTLSQDLAAVSPPIPGE
jgi:hypothetical protein